MSNEFKEKLHLYKEGNLSKNEAAEIESEIDKFSAILDYLDSDEKDFLEELKHQIPSDSGEEKRLAKHLKRRVNFRIIIMTTISVFLALNLIIFLFFSASNIAAALFGLNYKEAFVKREAIIQLAQMFHPQYKSRGSSVEKSLFAQQNIRVSLNNTVGNTLIDDTEISVRYSFGKPVRSGAATEVLPFVPVGDFSLLYSHESNPMSGFKVLEMAPQGTKAKIFVEFTKALTPQQLKENFINPLSSIDIAPIELTPMAALGSKFVIANPSYYQFTPVFPYDSKNAKQLEDNGLKQNQYENLDDQAHRESMIGNLNLIKNNQGLLQVMYYEDIFKDINIDDIIKQVENNGAEYIGMYISADSKELLTLKENPLIHCMRVENIVVW